MNRSTAAFLAVLLGVSIAITAPVAAAMWAFLVPLIASASVWQFSAAMAAVAVPFIYLMLRRMK